MAALPLATWAGDGDNDDFGTWLELGVEKVLPHNFSFGIDAELRMRDNSTKVDRLSVGGNLHYRVNKFLKVGILYSFMENYKDDKMSKEEYDIEDNLLAYRYTDSYWRPRHRLSVEVTPSFKMWKMLKVSYRARYQYTHQKEFTVSRYDYELDAATGTWDVTDCAKGDKTYDKEDTHIFRGRLKLEIDKKRLKWSPFISVETQKYLTHEYHYRRHRVRYETGTGYKFNKHHSMSLSYAYTEDPDSHIDGCRERHHALSLGYDYKF